MISTFLYVLTGGIVGFWIASMIWVWSAYRRFSRHLGAAEYVRDIVLDDLRTNGPIRRQIKKGL